MKPLHVVLIHSPSLLDPHWRAMYGTFSYPVPEFEVLDHIVTPRNTKTEFDLRGWRGRCDLVIHEDTRNWGSYGPRATRPPVAFRVLDSTECAKHYFWRRDQAGRADIIMLDMDPAERFADLGKPLVRSTFGLDERCFPDRQQTRDIDVLYPVGEARSRVRPALGLWLRDFCTRRGYSYVGPPFLEENTMSKSLPFADYVDLLNRSKIVINTNRTPLTRSARIFEVMACGACLVSEPPPVIEGEDFVAGRHYVGFAGLPVDGRQEDGPAVTFGPDDLPDLARALDWLVKDNRACRKITRAGQHYVLAQHTWSARATALRAALAEVLP